MTRPDIPPELARYARQIVLPGVGIAGQRTLGASHAIVVGLGALGTHTANMLARAGVGHLTLIDRDTVEHTNLQRQLLFTEAHARDGTPKAEAAASMLAAANSSIEVTPVVLDVSSVNAEAAFSGIIARIGRARGGATILVDGTDNVETRGVLNELAIKNGIDFIYAGVVGMRGLAMRVSAQGPCLRCIYPDTPPPGSLETCDVAGVSSPAVSMVTGLQASLALDACLGKPADGFLHEIALSPFRARSLDVSGMTDPSCPVCQLRQYPQLNSKIHSAPTVLCGQNAVQLPATANAVPGVDSHDSQPSILNLTEIADRLEKSVDVMTVQRSRFMCRGILHQSAAVRSISVFSDGRTIVHGTEDPSVARALRARLLG